VCNYNKVVSAVVRLIMSEAEFTPAVRLAFLQAVAAAARTSVDKITIVKIVPAGSGARRRMLEVSPGRTMHVLLEISGGVGRTLESELRGKLSARGLQAVEGRHVAWIEPHEVIVRKA